MLDHLFNRKAMPIAITYYRPFRHVKSGVDNFAVKIAHMLYGCNYYKQITKKAPLEQVLSQRFFKLYLYSDVSEDVTVSGVIMT